MIEEMNQDTGINQFRRAPPYPQTQGKIERCHQTHKKRILLDS
jgi:transposase InsO family protein